MPEELTDDYRGWHIQYDAEGFYCTPIPSFDWPADVDPEEYEIAQEASWETAADALRKAQMDIDSWWDDRERDAEG